MEKRIEVKCECNDERPSIDELLTHLGGITGITPDLLNAKNVEPVYPSAQARECPECGGVYFKGEDERVDAGLRCGRCAYSFGD